MKICYIIKCDQLINFIIIINHNNLEFQIVKKL